MRLSNRKNKLVVFIASFLFLLVTTISTVDARKGDRRAAGYSKRGPASSGSFKKQKKRQKQKRKAYKKANRRANDRKRERKDYKRERREDVRDYKKERREDRHDYRDERSERRERRQDRRTARRVVGAAALGVVAYNALKCRHEEVIVDGYAYSRCGNKWYEPVHRGGDVTYIVVEAPYGY